LLALALGSGGLALGLCLRLSLRDPLLRGEPRLVACESGAELDEAATRLGAENRSISLRLAAMKVVVPAPSYPAATLVSCPAETDPCPCGSTSSTRSAASQKTSSTACARAIHHNRVADHPSPPGQSSRACKIAAVTRGHEVPRPIFLLGPPGAGKTTLGSWACKELGFEFLDLADADLERLSWVVGDTAADVVELPWELQHERRALALVRKSGASLVLWAHPEDMQARAGRDEPLFTPVPRLKIRGGFGRNGTGCREFRHLERACDETLLLVDLPLEEAAETVRDCIAEIREENNAPPTEREGLAGWVEDWQQQHSASPRVTKVIVDAMARYLAHLRATGTSPRTLTGVCSDLNAAGHLVLMYGTLENNRILDHFEGPPYSFEFQRTFTDRPALVARYRRNLDGFARFLRGGGELPNEDG
jgi:hypothetical protein